MIRPRYRLKNTKTKQKTTAKTNYSNKPTVRKPEPLSKPTKDNRYQISIKKDQNNNENDIKFRPYPKVEAPEVTSHKSRYQPREKSVKKSDSYSANNKVSGNDGYRNSNKVLTPNKFRHNGRTRESRSASEPRGRSNQATSYNRRSRSSDAVKRNSSAFSWKQSNKLKYHEKKDVQSNDANVSNRRSNTKSPPRKSAFQYPLAKSRDQSREPSIDRNLGKSSKYTRDKKDSKDTSKRTRSSWDKQRLQRRHSDPDLYDRPNDNNNREEPSKDDSANEEATSPAFGRSQSFRNVNGTRAANMNVKSSVSRAAYDHAAGYRSKSTRAKMVTFYKNGDALFSGMKVSLTFHSMGALNDFLTARANIPNGARYIFTLDGRRVTRLEQFEHDGAYVVSGNRNFENLPYGQQKISDWQRNGVKAKVSGLRSADLNLIRPLPKSVQKLPNGKVSYSNTSGGSTSSMAGPGSRDGRIIQIINNLDHSISSRVLLNLKTTQMFSEVLEDLGHVLRIRDTPIKMYTMWGQEVQSFSQLRNEFKDVDSFYLCTGESHAKIEKKSAISDPGFYAIDPAVGGPVNYRHEFGKTKEEPVNPFQPVRATMNGVNGVRKEVVKRFPHQTDITRPDKRLRVDWVHGYQGQRGTNNLLVLPSGEMVYYVAAVIVLYHRHHNSQRHYLGHTEDVQCMALHPFSEVIATGQKSGKTQVTLSHVRIWDPDTLSTHAIIGLNEFDNGIESLCFGDNTDGGFLAVVDSSEEHVLSVWNWRDEIVQGKASLELRRTFQTQRESISGVLFHPTEENLIVTYGKQHLCIWKRHKDGIFDRNDIIKSSHAAKHVTALQFSPDGDIIAGDMDGYLVIYTRSQDEPDGSTWFVSKEFKAHDKHVTALYLLSEGTLLSAGGHDRNRQVKAWDALNRFKHITQSTIPPHAGGVVSMYPQKPGSGDGDIYIGTSRNMIMEGSVQRKFRTLVQGHYKPVKGVAAHPHEIAFVTVAHDRNVFKWSSEQMDWKIQVESDCNAVAIHPNGNVSAVACINGKAIILNIDNGMHVATIPITSAPLTAVSYSPDGSFLALGSHIGNIYIYTSLDKGFSYRRYNTLKGKIPVNTIDWSSDGLYLQSVATDNSLTFWDIRGPQQIRDPTLTMDMELHTHSSVMGYSIQGIWDNDHVKSESVNLACARSLARDVLAAGDNEGFIRLFRYPCLSRKAAFYEEKQYSSHISCLEFLRDDAYMVSVGGIDGAIIKWAILATANTAMY